MRLPAAEEEASKLLPQYVKSQLGNINVKRSGEYTVFVLDGGERRMATRKNDDGTISFVNADPPLSGFEFVKTEKDGNARLSSGMLSMNMCLSRRPSYLPQKASKTKYVRLHFACEESPFAPIKSSGSTAAGARVAALQTLWGQASGEQGYRAVMRLNFEQTLARLPVFGRLRFRQEEHMD